MITGQITSSGFEYMKYTLVTILAWLGVQMEVDWMIWYTYLLFFESITYVFSEAWIFRQFISRDFLVRMIIHMMMFILPITIAVMLEPVESVNSDMLVKATTTTMIVWLGAKTIGNISTFFTRKRVQFDFIMTSKINELLKVISENKEK